MKIQLSKSNPAEVEISHAGEVLSWPIREWSRTIKPTTGGVGHSAEELFKPLNVYWDSLPKNVQLEWFTLYDDAHYILKSFSEFAGGSVELTPRAIGERLSVIIRELFMKTNLVDFEYLCDRHNLLYFAGGIKDTLTEIDHPSLTYFTKDYRDLLILSAWIKAIIPIWGFYHDELTRPIGTPFVHMRAVDMLRFPEMEALPAWIRLSDYVSSFASSKITKHGYTLTSGIGRDEIPEFLFSILMIKKIAPYCGSATDCSIVVDMFSSLRQRCEDIDSTTVVDKDPYIENGAELDIAGQYKTMSPFTPGMQTLAECHFSDVEKIFARVYDLHPEYFIPEALNNLESWMIATRRDVMRYYDPHEPILDFRRNLAGVLLYGTASPRNLTVISREALSNAILAAAFVAYGWGYPEVGELLTQKVTKTDVYQLSISMVSMNQFNPIQRDVLLQLEANYPCLSRDRNPGIGFIDNMMKDIQQYDWNINWPKFKDLRTSTAQILLNVTKLKNGEL